MIKAPAMNDEIKFELTPAGNHVARLVKMVNIGTIDTGFKDDNGDAKIQPRIRLYFELPKKMKTYKDREGNDVTKPFTISTEVTLSMFKGKQVAKLRTIAEAMLGKTFTDEEAAEFDVESLLGLPCMVQVAHEQTKDKTGEYAKVAGITSVPEGMEIPPQVTPSEIVDVNTASQEEIGALSEFLRTKIESSIEYKQRFNAIEL